MVVQDEQAEVEEERGELFVVSMDDACERALEAAHEDVYQQALEAACEDAYERALQAATEEITGSTASSTVRPNTVTNDETP